MCRAIGGRHAAALIKARFKRPPLLDEVTCSFLFNDVLSSKVSS